MVCSIFQNLRESVLPARDGAAAQRRSGSSRFGIAALLLMACGVSSCAASRDPVPLTTVDLDRISGGWYIVATIPNFLEKGVLAGYDVFTPQSSDVIREDFYMQKGGFDSEKHHFTTKITVQSNTGNADWRVHLFWPITLPFQIYYVDPDYKYLLFGEQNRDWGWIYSRAQIISDEDYNTMLGHFKALGYDTSKFRKFVQIPAQIGKPGYWSDEIQ